MKVPNDSEAALNVLCLRPMTLSEVREVLDRRGVILKAAAANRYLGAHVQMGRAAEGPLVASQQQGGPREVKTYTLTPSGEEWLRKRLPQGWL